MTARCKLGGPAPCVDDMCHNCEETLCGIPREWIDDEGDFEDDYLDMDDDEVAFELARPQRAES